MGATIKVASGGVLNVVRGGGLWVAVAWLGGCAYSIPIQPSQIPELLAVNRGESVTLESERGPVQITLEEEPDLRLHLDRDCSIFESHCPVVVAPVSSAKMEGDVLRIGFKTSVFFGRLEKREISPGSIQKAEVILHGVDPPGWRPVWGMGIFLVGPMGFGGWNLQVIPWDWLAVEMGVLPGADVLDLTGGVRLRPIRFGSVRPFLGGFATLGKAFGASDGRSADFSAVGGRTGVDLEFVRGHMLVTLEFDLVHPVNSDQAWISDFSGLWIPWGGGTVSYFW